MKRFFISPGKQHFYFGITRYLLGIWMIPYAITKILGTQFVLSGYQLAKPQTLEYLANTQLTWLFLGRSASFQILLGILELIPAILLLFRRTAFLGAILMLPITLNICLINHALELWEGTKLVSSILLGLNLILFAFKWRSIKSIMIKVLGKDLSFRFITTEIVLNMLLLLMVSYFSLKPILEVTRQTDVLTGDWRNQRPIEWILKKEIRNDSILTERNLKLYFSIYDGYNEIGDTQEPIPISYTVNTDNNLLCFKYQSGAYINCKYQLIGKDSLRIVYPLKKETGILTQYYVKRVINSD